MSKITENFTSQTLRESIEPANYLLMGIFFIMGVVVAALESDLAFNVILIATVLVWPLVIAITRVPGNMPTLINGALLGLTSFLTAEGAFWAGALFIAGFKQDEIPAGLVGAMLGMTIAFVALLASKKVWEGYIRHAYRE